ncbi:MAG: type II toxin-antitoxin system death-on-curing family toxin [Thermomicrobiales bacterium]
MRPTQYLSLGDVIAIHEQAMRRLGSAPNPLRDEGLLESAVMRPQMAAHYEGADIVRQAALLGIGISQAQAFLDGNKRTAYLALNTFLRMNGLSYTGDRIDLARQFEQFAERSSDPAEATDAFEAWLRELVQPRPQRE